MTVVYAFTAGVAELPRLRVRVYLAARERKEVDLERHLDRAVLAGVTVDGVDKHSMFIVHFGMT